ncbi:hypothetical protein EJ05DRAFT_50455 [Pseudovirgaria hyperparasitica]|uniref:Uncharacterized protein n=1 Tax=Pseudovirgaria hyperparasitica TaxID=470096 RepID=A0A6A6W4W4_9PEZI|nr:uncharacterized protein EJ05DRAFT_50455 [Pseudovirgaria hyperparasitica]KAF2756996.1 hypothetical protein EJ05DRAFT_50455 [Pseudovirgaria hyperparasitica]
MSTAGLVILTHPLPSAPLGQLIEEPISPTSKIYTATAMFPDSPTQISSTSLRGATRRVCHSSNSLSGSLMKIEAHDSVRSTLENDRTIFRSLCQDPGAQKWMHDMTKAGRRFSFVVGTQELRNAKFTPVDLSPQRISAHAHDDSTQVPSNIKTAPGLEARKVKCLVGRHDAPHSLEDVDYDWNYFSLSDDMQLAIGLGATSGELQALVNASINI